MRAFLWMDHATRYLKATDLGDIVFAAEILKRGGIGAIPTETVYGLAADALNVSAISRIFEAKMRPPSDPLIVHVENLEGAEQLAHIPDAARALAAQFWPGPLTLIAPKMPHVPDLVTSGLATVAIRCPHHPVARQLLSTSQLALAAPSANLFGALSPTCANHVRTSLDGRIDFVLDGGSTGWGLESTILDLSVPGQASLYRPGPVSVDAMQKTLRESGFNLIIVDLSRQVKPESHPAEPLAMPSPGLFARHYAPRTPLFLISDSDINELLNETMGSEQFALVLTGLGKPLGKPSNHVFYCSADGSEASAANRFYALLHQIDSRGFAKIYVELFPDHHPLLRALNNRLSRAAHSTNKF